jgi:hypothetical protein
MGDDGLGGSGSAGAGFRGRDEGEYLPLFPACSRCGQRAYFLVPRKRGPNTTLLASMNVEGMGPALAVKGAITAAVLRGLHEEVLAPKLRPGQVMDFGQPLRA